ncbi:MAG TPA: hypothetical protein EYM47_04350 [Candidatus Marinimicrobia bacterium]|jgi:hypothetical protein|nr:hypothetical protein [Candidatus Neomarinimicrobiota bacterium]
MKTLNDFSQIKAANFWVNVSLVSFLLLSACAKIIEQQSNILVPSPTELYYQKYFVQHKDKLDPIEGIWTENVVATLYENNKVVTRETEAERATWVIIKKGKEYVILNRYGEQNKFIASFKSGQKEGTYIYTCFDKQTKENIKAEAKMIQNNLIEMEYDAPESVLKENYHEYLNVDSSQIDQNYEKKNIVLHWQFNWLKILPLDKG